jgi:hypothetical protein
MKVLEGKEKEYKEWYDKNADAYGRACFTYAERWAEMMEDLIDRNPDKSLKDIIIEKAEETSHKANEEGITGFMYGCAVSILSECWMYGEELRIWHNAIYHYDGSGVVNPAVITISREND